MNESRFQEIIQTVAENRDVELPEGWRSHAEFQPTTRTKLEAYCHQTRTSIEGGELDVLEYIGHEVKFQLAIELGWLELLLNQPDYNGKGSTFGQLLCTFAEETVKDDTLDIKELFDAAAKNGCPRFRHNLISRVGELTPDKFKRILNLAGFTDQVNVVRRRWSKVTKFHAEAFLIDFLDSRIGMDWCFRHLDHHSAMTIDGNIKGATVQRWLNIRGIRDIDQLKEFTGDHTAYSTAYEGRRIKSHANLLAILKRFASFIRSQGGSSWKRSELQKWRDGVANVSGGSIFSYIERNYNMTIDEFIETHLSEEFADIEFDASGLKVLMKISDVREYMEQFTQKTTEAWSINSLCNVRVNGISGAALRKWMYMNKVRHCIQEGMSPEAAWRHIFDEIGIDTEHFVYRGRGIDF